MNDTIGQTVRQLLPTNRRRSSVIAMAASSGQMARYAVQAGADLLLVLNATDDVARDSPAGACT